MLNTTRTNSATYFSVAKLTVLMQVIFIYLKVTSCSAPKENAAIASLDEDEILNELKREEMLARVEGVESEKLSDSKHSLESKRKEVKEPKEMKRFVEAKKNVKGVKFEESNPPKFDLALKNNERCFCSDKRGKEKLGGMAEYLSSKPQKLQKSTKTIDEGEISYIFENDESVYGGTTDYETMTLCLQILEKVPVGDVNYCFESEDIYEAGFTDERTANACLYILNLQKNVNGSKSRLTKPAEKGEQKKEADKNVSFVINL